MTSLQDFLVRLAGFIDAILIPVLFGIAFLFFLINIFRYFILEGANEQSRDKAKRSAIYGLAAFVFLLVLWSLVGILIAGLNINNQDQSLCSDYIRIFRGDCGRSGTAFDSESNFPLGIRPIGTGGSAGTPSGPTGEDTSNGTIGSRPLPPQVAPLAELVFGTGKDAARFAANQEAPQALLTTPTVAPAASCTDGITTLQQASRVESNQASYLLSIGTSGSAWTNVTDAHSANSIVHDADTIRLTASESDTTHLIHTHPEGRLDGLGLVSGGHGPTTADFLALCSDNESPQSHIIVDWDGAWHIETSATTCPLAAPTITNLTIAETLIALANLESSSRTEELERYLADELPAGGAKTYLTNLFTENPTLLTADSTSELLRSANAVLSDSGVEVTYYNNASALCSAL